MSAARYAIYYAPAPDSALWQFGSGVLAYDAATGADLSVTPLAELGAEVWTALTADPRRYGFHATLKAPFHLAEGCDEAGLVAAVAELARGRAPVPLGALAVAQISRFIALVPVSSPPALAALAFDVVQALEPFRAPLLAEDRARRAPDRLTPRQRDYLDRYGYPYVGEEFRFHMTLTGALEPMLAGRLQPALEAAYRDAMPDPAVVLDRIAIFRQPDRTQRFRQLAAFGLGA